MSGHIVSVRTYVTIFLCLIALTALTTGVAFIDLGSMNTVAALAIAVVKMMLVVLFFMHVKYSSGFTRVVILSGVFFLALLMAFTAADIFTRQWTPTAQGWGQAQGASQGNTTSTPSQ